jgi:hypothetical protein
VVVGPTFVRRDPFTDPTRLVLRTYRNTAPAGALSKLSRDDGVKTTARRGTRAGEVLQWKLFRGQPAAAPRDAAEVAVATDGGNTYLAALVARRAELAGLVETALLPRSTASCRGPLTGRRAFSRLSRRLRHTGRRPRGALHRPPRRAWTGKRLDAMLARIRADKLPIDSVTVIRHGYVVLDARFEGLRLRQARTAVRVGPPARTAVGNQVDHLDASLDRLRDCATTVAQHP